MSRRGMSLPKRLLALVSAMSLLLVGLSAVLFAPVATATTSGGPGSNDPATVCAYYAPGYVGTPDRYDGSGVAGATIAVGSSSVTFADPAKSGTWTSTKYVIAMVVHAGGGLDHMTFGSAVPGYGKGNWATYDNKGLSTITFCYGTPPQQYSYTAEAQKASATICLVDETILVEVWGSR